MLELECKNLGITLTGPSSIEEFNEVLSSLQKSTKKTHSSFFDEIEGLIKECSKFTTENISNYKELKQAFYSLLMYREVIRMTGNKYRQAQAIERDIVHHAEDEEEEDLKKSLLRNEYDSMENAITTTNIAGVVDQSDILRLRRLVFRATRGKAICMAEDIDPEMLKEEGIHGAKTMYLIIFQSGEFLNAKIKNI